MTTAKFSVIVFLIFLFLKYFFSNHFISFFGRGFEGI